MATEISQLLAEGVAKLGRATEAPRREAEILLAAALGRPRAWLIAHPDEPVLDCEATDRYESHVTRRSHGEPVAYILGEKEFWSLRLEITRDVLVPRPETERLVECALARTAPGTTGHVLDLATGSGAVALALAHERPRARVVGTDLSVPAVELARRNASRLNLANVEFRAGDWYSAVPGERYELVVSNPPYVAHDDPRVEAAVRRFEPHAALFAAEQGLAALRQVVRGAPAHLVDGGWLLVEHGESQGQAVRALFASVGFDEVATHRDLAGLERCTEGRLRRTLRDGGL